MSVTARAIGVRSARLLSYFSIVASLAACGHGGPNADPAQKQISTTAPQFTTQPANQTVRSNAATLTATAAAAGTDVVTYKYDVMRTGQNLTESTLTPSLAACTTPCAAQSQRLIPMNTAPLRIGSQQWRTML